MDTVTAPRSWAQGVRDWTPVALILVAYLMLHQLAPSLTPGAHVQPQLGFDEWLFGGTAPTVRLQDALWTPGNPHWYDFAAWLVYLSHFVVTLTVAIVLWARAYPLFRRFRTLFLAVTFAGFVTYVAYPAIPPWLAGNRGDMEHTVRIVRAMWLELGLSDVAAVFGEKSKYAFPVGALPSLHAAWPFLLLVFFWPIAGRWRIALVAYALAMAFTLVYTADHFVFDVLLGWTYVLVACLFARFLHGRRRPISSRSVFRGGSRRRPRGRAGHDPSS
ncbi:MAG: phosphatase PAP2 family protein [Acidimicrobiia bacterium]